MKLDKKDENVTPIRFDMFIKCARSLCELCQIAQRGLWLNFPELLDNVYAVAKALLVSDLHLST